MDSTIKYNSITTDRELATILGRFSEDTIIAAVDEALMYKYRPFDNRMPNLPETINQQFAMIKAAATDGVDQINECEMEAYITIINRVCQVYNLSITSEIPADMIYPLSLFLYQNLVSEFTMRMLMFFSNYILINKENLIASIPDAKRIDHHTSYSKRMLPDPAIVTIYENMESIIDIIAGLDFSLFNLMEQFSNKETATFITNFISDNGDIYKNYIASYIYGQVSRTDMVTSIKLRFLELSGVQLSMTQPPISE